MYRKLIYFAFGLGMSSPLLALVIGGRIISLTSLTLILILLDLWKSHRNISVRSNADIKNKFKQWMNISLISSLFGFLFFLTIDMKYSYSALESIPKILLYYLLYYLFSKNIKGRDRMIDIGQGVKYGIVLNLAWSIADASLFYTMGISITNDLFSSYITASGLPHGMCSMIEGFAIRSAGLNIDMVTIGCFAVSAVVYSFLYDKKWLLVLGVLACFASVSFIGIVGVAFAFIWRLFFFKETKNRFLKICFMLGVIICAYIYYQNSTNTIISGMRTATELRAESKSSGDQSASIRMFVIEKFPACVIRMPTSLIVGTGYFSAVYPYYQEGLEYAKYNIKNPQPTAMENTFIQYFFDLGFIGLLFFIGLIYKITKTSYSLYSMYKDNFYAMIFCYMFGAFWGYLFYHNILYSIDMLTYIAGSLYLISYYPQIRNRPHKMTQRSKR